MVTAVRRMPDLSRGSQDIGRILVFLDRFRFTGEQYWAAYPDWSRGEALEPPRWKNSGLGGTYTMHAIMWYRYVHRPGSGVYRPSVILDALCKAAGAGNAPAGR